MLKKFRKKQQQRLLQQYGNIKSTVSQKQSKRASVSAAAADSPQGSNLCQVKVLVNGHPSPTLDEQKTTERGRDAVETLDVIQAEARDDSPAQSEKEEDIQEKSPIDLARELTTDFMESVKDTGNYVAPPINLVKSQSTKAKEDAGKSLAPTINLVKSHSSSSKTKEDAGKSLAPPINLVRSQSSSSKTKEDAGKSLAPPINLVRSRSRETVATSSDQTAYMIARAQKAKYREQVLPQRSLVTHAIVSLDDALMKIFLGRNDGVGVELDKIEDSEWNACYEECKEFLQQGNDMLTGKEAFIEWLKIQEEELMAGKRLSQEKVIKLKSLLMPIAGEKKRQHDELRVGPLDHLFLKVIYGVTVEEVKGSIQKQQVAEFKENLRDMMAKGKNHWDIMKRIGQLVADMNAPPPPTWTEIALARSLETVDDVGKKTLDDVHKTLIDVGETFDKALEDHLDGVNLNLHLSFQWKAAGNDDSTYVCDSTYASSQPSGKEKNNSKLPKNWWKHGALHYWFKVRRDDETIFCDDCDDTKYSDGTKSSAGYSDDTKSSTDDSSFVSRRSAESHISEKWLQR